MNKCLQYMIIVLICQSPIVLWRYSFAKMVFINLMTIFTHQQMAALTEV